MSHRHKFNWYKQNYWFFFFLPQTCSSPWLPCLSGWYHQPSKPKTWRRLWERSQGIKKLRRKAGSKEYLIDFNLQVNLSAMLLISLSGCLSSLSALLLLHGFHSQPGLLLLPLDCWHGSSCLSAYASTVYTPSAASSWSTVLPNEALLLHWHCFISWNRLNSRTFSPEVPLTGLPSHSSSLWPAHSHPTDLPSKLFQVRLSEVVVSASKHTVSCQSIHFPQSIYHNVN